MRLNRILGLMFALAILMPAQQGTVQNAALYQPAIFPGVGLVGYVVPNTLLVGDFGYILSTGYANTISPRMLAVLSYSAGETIATLGSTPVAPPVTATLSIRPAGSNTAIPVTVTNAVAGAITFVVPAAVPLGGAELLYQIAGQPTQWTTVNVVQSSFAFFRTGSGGPAIAQTVASNGSISNVGLTTPAQPGQTLLLTGSGLGYGSTVSATIGGIAAPLIYAGAGPTQAGHDEILLQIPAAVPDGCYVPVAVTYNQTTLTTTIAKTSDGSPCRHPWQLSVADMKTLDNGGSLTDALIGLSTQLSVVTSNAASRNESANMELGQINPSGIAEYFSPAPSGPGCTVPVPAGVGLAYTAVFALPPNPAVPNIGASVTLQTPTTAITLAGMAGFFEYSANLPPPTDGPLSNLPTPIIAGGKWTFQSSGGPDLPASSFGFTLPAPIQLAGGAPISVSRNRDQTITWNGAAFDAGATVNIYLSGSTAPVTCTAPASAGTVTIPASLLSGYAANTIGTLSINLNESGFFLPHAQFQLHNGTTLLMVVSFSSNDSRPVFFQ
jgi:uncharacterized protein (TIGR03437 family)